MENLALTGDHEQIDRCLRALAQGHGIWRSDLVDRLKGEWSPLQRHWNINLASGLEAVRNIVWSNLIGYIENLYPRRAHRPVSPEDVDWSKEVAEISFNASTKREAVVLRRSSLQQRRDWLLLKYGRDRSASMRSLQRILDEAIEQIAERMVKVAAGAASSPGVSVELATPPRPPRQGNSLAHLVELSGELQQALNFVRDACKAQNRIFYTSDLLVTLLDLPGKRAAQCFDEATHIGQAVSIREQLAATLGDDRHHEPFVPFTWLERSDVQLAAEYAISDGRLVVSELHLLLAILDSDSATNRWLQRLLREEYPQVRAVAERHRHNGPTVVNSPTPDGLW
ncbi:hypothetical protein [Amycolatopsis sp. NBC_01286]|uniref:hypothetical protein n=1 Tax=Amycolatopsis sp. NBC_01286 TaxID=2903560 RepID=UPI002E126E0D|nr:hypothetical protein OG570_00195 [Amycolatopsis sp. NBC_01286]